MTTVFAIDVRADRLHWARGSVLDNFTGAVTDQGVMALSRSEAETKISVNFKLAVESLIESLCSGAAVHCGLVSMTYRANVVPYAIKATGWQNVFAAEGVDIGCSDEPMASYTKHATRRDDGGRWYFIDQPEMVRYDSNHWKDFAADRIEQGSRGGAWEIFGGEYRPQFIEQLQSEESTRYTGRRAVNVWRLKPGRENHFWNTFVMLQVAASIAGCRLPELVESLD